MKNSRKYGLLLAMEGNSIHTHNRDPLTYLSKSDDKSPASFEKILSNVSIKISKASNRLDGLRQRSRRLKVLWTLYAGFAYLLYTVILILVVGWRKWGLMEYTAVAGGPVMYSPYELFMQTGV